MGFHLIYSRNNFHITGNVDKMIRVKIAHADSSKFSFFICFFQCPVCAVTVAEWLVKQHQVDVIRLQLAQALVYGSLRLFIAVVGNPHFRDQKNLFAVDTAFLHGIAYTLFVVIGLRRVNHPITDFQGIAYAVFALGRRNLIDTVAHLGHFNTVV